MPRGVKQCCCSIPSPARWTWRLRGTCRALRSTQFTIKRVSLTTINRQHTDQTFPTYRPQIGNILTTYWAYICHIPTTDRLRTDHIPTTNRPHNDQTFSQDANHKLTTYWPLTDHILTTYRIPTTNFIDDVYPHSKPIIYQPQTNYRPPQSTTYWSHTDQFSVTLLAATRMRHGELANTAALSNPSRYRLVPFGNHSYLESLSDKSKELPL